MKNPPKVGNNSLFADRAHNLANMNIRKQIVAGLRQLPMVPIKGPHSALGRGTATHKLMEELGVYERALSASPDPTMLPYAPKNGYRAREASMYESVLASASYVLTKYWQFRKSRMRTIPQGIVKELVTWSKWANAERLTLEGDERIGFTIEVEV